MSNLIVNLRSLWEWQWWHRRVRWPCSSVPTAANVSADGTTCANTSGPTRARSPSSATPAVVASRSHSRCESTCVFIPTPHLLPRHRRRRWRCRWQVQRLPPISLSSLCLRVKVPIHLAYVVPKTKQLNQKPILLPVPVQSRRGRDPTYRSNSNASSITNSSAVREVAAAAAFVAESEVIGSGTTESPRTSSASSVPVASPPPPVAPTNPTSCPASPSDDHRDRSSPPSTDTNNA